MCAFPNHFRSERRLRVTCAQPWGNAGNSTRVPDAVRALGGANGSRECAPDDRLRIVRRGRSGLGPSNVVSAYPRSSPGFCDSPDDLSRPAIARLGSDPVFSGLHIVMGRPWHDIRIVTDAGGHWRNISSELPALGEQMGEVIKFIPKPAPHRQARLIQEPRAIYESIFPTEIASIAPIEDDDTSR